jgi:hypothetical protein
MSRIDHSFTIQPNFDAVTRHLSWHEDDSPSPCRGWAVTSCADIRAETANALQVSVAMFVVSAVLIFDSVPPRIGLRSNRSRRGPRRAQ